MVVSASPAEIAAEVWWPLAVASARAGFPVTGPDSLLKSPADLREVGASLLALVDADDPVWDRYAKDRSAAVRTAVARLTFPERLFEALCARGNSSVLAALARNESLTASQLAAVPIPYEWSDAILPAFAANPVFVAAHLPAGPMFTQTMLRDGPSAAIASFYERVFGDRVWCSGVRPELAPAWLRNTATRPTDIEQLFAGSGLGPQWAYRVLSSPSAPASLLAREAAKALVPLQRVDAEIARLVGSHRATPPEVLERFADVRYLVRYVVRNPSLPAETVARLYASLTPGEPVPAALLDLFANPHVSREQALAFLDGADIHLLDRIVTNPNVTFDDIVELEASHPRAVEAYLAATCHWRWFGTTSWRFSEARTGSLWVTRPPAGTPPIPESGLGPLLALAAADVPSTQAVTAAGLL